MTLTKLFLFLALAVGSFALPPKINLNATERSKIPAWVNTTATRFLRLSKAEKIAIINEYSENLLTEANAYIQQMGMDPLPIEDVIADFEWTIFFGEVSLRNGELKGIGSLQRSGDVTVRYEYPVLKLHLPMSFKSLGLEYDYKIQFMNLGPNGVMTGTVDGCKYTLDLDFDLTTLRIKMDRFKLNTIGKLNLKFHGGVLEWIVNLFLKVIVGLLTPIIQWVLDGNLEPAINAVIESVNGILEQLLGVPEV